MKSHILDINGKKGKEIELPKCFSGKVRGDIVAKVLEVQKTQQPYGPSPVAGKQSSARGKIRHLRHVWKSGYGRGRSRIPRKIMRSSGSQFVQVGAGIPSVRGGMRAHPPKVISMINTKKINKKELRIALISAISATADREKVLGKYEKLKGHRIEHLPLIVEDKIVKLKTKELLASLKNILGKNLFEVALKKKSIRSGRGTMRGRKYKSSAGMILVVGEKEKLKTNVFDVKNVKELGVSDLAKGGLGRLTVYTEKAVSEFEDKFGGKKK